MLTQERMLSASAAEKAALSEGYEHGLAEGYKKSAQKAKEDDYRRWAVEKAIQNSGGMGVEAAALRYLSFLETGSFGESVP